MTNDNVLTIKFDKRLIYFNIKANNKKISIECQFAML